VEEVRPRYALARETRRPDGQKGYITGMRRALAGAGKLVLLAGRLIGEEDAQDLTEYALIMVFVSVGVLSAVAAFGTALEVRWDSLVAELGAIFGGG